MTDFITSKVKEVENVEKLDSTALCHSEESIISGLEEKLKDLNEEKIELERQLNEAQKKYKQKRHAINSGLMNAEFNSSLMQFVLPVKRSRISKFPCSTLDSKLSENVVALKYFLNPVTNFMYRKMHETTKDVQIKLKQSNDDLAAWKFTPDSAIGKRLMARIRHLLNANEDLGRVNQADRVSVLESEAEIQTTCIRELMKTNEDIESVLEEAYADLEGLQSSLLILQQQINQTESIVEALQNELESKQPGLVAELMAELLVKFSENNANTIDNMGEEEEGGGDDEDDDNNNVDNAIDEDDDCEGINNVVDSNAQDL